MIRISPAEADHLEALAGLLEEMDRFYGVTDFEPAANRVRQIGDVLFGDPPSAYAVLAWSGSRLVGMASYSHLWPADGVTRSLYLKELYVANEYQRQSIGKFIMQYICRIALSLGCSRVEWTTDIDNDRARKFYKSLGIDVMSSKVFYRIDSERLADFSAQVEAGQ